MTPFEALSSQAQPNGAKESGASKREIVPEGEQRSRPFEATINDLSKKEQEASGSVDENDGPQAAVSALRESIVGLPEPAKRSGVSDGISLVKEEADMAFTMPARDVAGSMDAPEADWRNAMVKSDQGLAGSISTSALPPVGQAPAASGSAPLPEAGERVEVARTSDELRIPPIDGKPVEHGAPPERLRVAAADPVLPSRSVEPMGAEATVRGNALSAPDEVVQTAPAETRPHVHTERATVSVFGFSQAVEVEKMIEQPPRVPSQAPEVVGQNRMQPAAALPPMTDYLPTSIGTSAAFGETTEISLPSVSTSDPLEQLAVPGRTAAGGILGVLRAGQPFPPILQQLIPQITTRGADAPGDAIEIRLDPPELGRVRILFSGSEGAMSGLVTADRGEIEAMLRRNADVLQNALKDAGFADVSLMFGAHDQQGAADSFESSARETSDSLRVVLEEAGQGAPATLADRHSSDGTASLDIRL